MELINERSLNINRIASSNFFVSSRRRHTRFDCDWSSDVCSSDLGSWIYIGTQGILQGTYETFAAAAKKHFGGDLKGKLVVTGGMGGMGGAQPLAATMNGAAFLGIDVDPERIKKRLKTGYCDVMVTSLDEALRILKNAVRKGQ